MRAHSTLPPFPFPPTSAPSPLISARLRAAMRDSICCRWVFYASRMGILHHENGVFCGIYFFMAIVQVKGCCELFGAVWRGVCRFFIRFQGGKPPATSREMCDEKVWSLVGFRCGGTDSFWMRRLWRGS